MDWRMLGQEPHSDVMYLAKSVKLTTPNLIFKKACIVISRNVKRKTMTVTN